MSDVANMQSEVTATNGEGQPTSPAPKITLEEALAKLDAQEKTINRVLNESKEWKSKAQLHKEEKERIEKEKLTEKEDYKKLYENLDGTFSKFKKSAISTALKTELLQHAPDLHNFDLALKALPADKIQAIEDDDQIKIIGVKEVVDDWRKSQNFLFKPQSVPTMVTGKPAGHNAQSLNGNKAKTLKEMNQDEIKAYWKANPSIK